MLMRRAAIVICLTMLATAPIGAQSTVTELNDAGWKALNAGDADRAARLFGEALTYRPNDPVLLLGAGASAHAQGKPDVALSRLKRSVELDPKLTVASRLLGQIAFQEGDVALAIRTYENALKYAPKDAALAADLAAWRQDTSTHQTFEERRYDRFRVMFEGRAEESVAARATTILDRAFWRIGSTLGDYPSQTIVTILYTEKQFRDITRAPDWSVGQYDGRIRIPVAGANDTPELFERVLVHELTHAMIASMAPRGVPTWLNEGMAQYFEGASVAAARKRMAARGGWIPLKDLESSFMGLNAAAAAVAYDESLMAASVIFERPGFSWSRLLHTLADGQPFARAIETFGFSYADLEKGD